MMSRFWSVSLCVALAACGGKVADGTDAGTPILAPPTPPEPFPDDPGPTPSEPGPTLPSPPPPIVDAGVTPGDTLVSGSPQCSKHLPATHATCRTLMGYTPKCEYDVTLADAGTCRWFCYCGATSPDSMTFEWVCAPTDCP
jgi:hypothetical protein